jgi:hypothetical protein
MNESITQAAQTADLLCRELTDALCDASPILVLLLMERLEEAANLRRELDLLKKAAEEDDE